MSVITRLSGADLDAVVAAGYSRDMGDLAVQASSARRAFHEADNAGDRKINQRRFDKAMAKLTKLGIADPDAAERIADIALNRTQPAPAPAGPVLGPDENDPDLPGRVQLGDRFLRKLKKPYNDTARERGSLYAHLVAVFGPDVQIGNAWNDPETGNGRLGLIMGDPPDMSQPHRRIAKPGTTARDWELANAVAEASGQTLIDWQTIPYVNPKTGDPEVRYASIMAFTAPFDLWLRGRIAEHLNIEPYKVGLSTRWTVDSVIGGTVESIRIWRSPLIREPLVRRRTWQTVIDQVLPVSPNAAWRIVDKPGEGSITLTRQPDPLSDKMDLPEFCDRYRTGYDDPWADWKKFPVAIREDGSTVPWLMQHTLIVGATGSGKGSPIWSIVSGLLPSAREGLVRFDMIDPKAAEGFVGPDGDRRPNGIFDRVVTRPDDWADLLHTIVLELQERQKVVGRTFKVSKERPLRIIVIDELSALSVLDTDPRRASEAKANLLIIASQGRSAGFVIVGAVQAPQKDMVGPIRGFMGFKVALRTDTRIETDIVLGDSATDQGALSHEIAPANVGNDWATAGIAYLRTEGEPEPIRVRFPRTEDEVLEDWSDEFENLRALWAAGGAPTVVSDIEVTFSLDELNAMVEQQAESDYSGAAAIMAAVDAERAADRPAPEPGTDPRAVDWEF